MEKYSQPEATNLVLLCPLDQMAKSIAPYSLLIAGALLTLWRKPGPRLILWAALFFFSFSLSAAATDTWSDVQRIVAVGDLHGDYGQFVAVLRSAEIIDRGGKWRGGSTHLVQLGDVPDRGPDTLKIIKHLQRLKKQARRAKGEVHLLIGNHDAMNTYGDLRFVHPGEYKAFVDSGSYEFQEEHFQKMIRYIQRTKPESEWPKFDSKLRERFVKNYPLGFVEHRQAWRPGGKIGDWVCERNTVIKINDTLFLHGGISPAFAHLSISEFNSSVRTELKTGDPPTDGLVRAEEGPLWYRGLALHDEEDEMTHLLDLLEKYHVERIVIAHTTTAGAIMPRFGGRVILTDVGLASPYGSNVACLRIDRDGVYAIHRGTPLLLPTDSEVGLLRYLKKAAELDPPPSPLKREIERLESSLGKAGQAAPAVNGISIQSDAAVS